MCGIVVDGQSAEVLPSDWGGGNWSPVIDKKMIQDKILAHEFREGG